MGKFRERMKIGSCQGALWRRKTLTPKCTRSFTLDLQVCFITR